MTTVLTITHRTTGNLPQKVFKEKQILPQEEQFFLRQFLQFEQAENSDGEKVRER